MWVESNINADVKIIIVIDPPAQCSTFLCILTHTSSMSIHLPDEETTISANRRAWLTHPPPAKALYSSNTEGHCSPWKMRLRGRAGRTAEFLLQRGFRNSTDYWQWLITIIIYSHLNPQKQRLKSSTTKPHPLPFPWTCYSPTSGSVMPRLQHHLVPSLLMFVCEPLILLSSLPSAEFQRGTSYI